MGFFQTSRHSTQLNSIPAVAVRSDLLLVAQGDDRARHRVYAESLFAYAARVLDSAALSEFTQRLRQLKLPQTAGELAALDSPQPYLRQIKALIYGLTPEVTLTNLGQFANVRVAGTSVGLTVNVGGGVSAGGAINNAFAGFLFNPDCKDRRIRGDLSILFPVTAGSSAFPLLEYRGEAALTYVTTGTGAGTARTGVVRHGGQMFIKSAPVNTQVANGIISGIPWNPTTGLAAVAPVTAAAIEQDSPHVIFPNSKSDREVLKDVIEQDGLGFATALFLDPSDDLRVIKASTQNVPGGGTERERLTLGGRPDVDTDWIELPNMRSGDQQPRLLVTEHEVAAGPGEQLGIVKHALWVRYGDRESGTVTEQHLIADNSLAGSPSRGVSFFVQSGGGVNRLGVLLGERAPFINTDAELIHVRVLLWLRGTLN